MYNIKYKKIFVFLMKTHYFESTVLQASVNVNANQNVLYQVMTKYISNPDNLKLMMNMLKEKSRNIQFEAFHVFKVR